MILKIILFTAGGALAGFALQKLIGCSGGSCPIMRSSTTSVLYGAVIGLLMSIGK